MNEQSSEAQGGLRDGWHEQLAPEFDKQYMRALREFLQARKAEGKTVYPPGPEMFTSFNLTPFESVRVVILGQDPYHGPGQAHGLSFSVKKGCAVPPSLKNIYKELHDDLGVPIPSHGHLEAWAKQGVLLLNAVLTVEASNAGAHQGKGWEPFTDRAIQVLGAEREHVVFMLWGGYAKKKGALVNGERHLVLHAPHPSPLSAHRGFLGCRHFSQANAYLQRHGVEPIDWALPP
ncbi:MAG: uracil-DNA glycosylase [Pseudomonadota bacterium]